MISNFTKVHTNLNIDVLQHILSYNDDMRILKVKMNQQNIKYLFESSRDIYNYLWCMKRSLEFSNKKKERIYVDILELLSNKNYKMKEIKNHILSLPSYHEYLNESHDWFDYFMDLIINNYNNYYLDDRFYYNGYWRNNYWVCGEGEKFYDGYPRILKTKMNEHNIKHLFEKNRDIYAYLWCMEKNRFVPPNIEEQIYLDMIKLLKNKKCSMEKIRQIISSVSLYSDYLLDPDNEYHYYIRHKNWFNYFIAIIINNYHTYYLNDNYYFKGYWYDNAWIKDDDKDYYDGYPYQFTW
jgi:hypothetical protein